MTLDFLVREYIIGIGDNTPHKYARFLQYGIETLRDLHLDVSGVAKMVSLDVNINGTVDLPDDYISELGVYVCGEDGNLHTLGRNRDMCPPSTDDCGELQANSGT